ncbi:MAG: 4-alpha-glucanotransferase [Roseobacter sp.]
MQNADQALNRLADLAGVFADFKDMQGVTHRASADTQRALLRALGYEVATAAEVADTLAETKEAQNRAYTDADIVLVAGVATSVSMKQGVDWAILPDAGTQTLAEGISDGAALVPALPIGFYKLFMRGAEGEQTAFVIAAPASAPLLRDATGQAATWGVVAALYGLRGSPSKAFGDYSDLGHLAATLGTQGAGFLGVNPVHALGWAATDTISPYSPTHRGFLNTDHISVLGKLTENDGDLLEYYAYRGQHRPLLRQAYARFQSHSSTADRDAYAAFVALGGDALDRFAAFEALSETHGPDWRQWPSALQQGPAPSITMNPQACDFHRWLQWQADTQLGAAQDAAISSGMALGLYLDLAVGARLGGAESWGSPSTAQGVSLGAPPDQLSPAGQNWQLAALSPHKLRATGYKDFRDTLRYALRHCGLFRIDHALGLNRSFWLPEDGSPGGYIRQPFRTLMAIIAVEAHLSGTVIVGEDLGLVPQGFRETMMQQGLYSYSVLQYEKDSNGRFLPLDRLRAQSLACFGTHDTPTFKGYWSGSDIDWWHDLAWIDKGDRTKLRAARTREKKQLSRAYNLTSADADQASELRDKMHAQLAQAPSALVAVQLDDLLDVTQAQNLPGTIDQHPNWRRRAPLTIPQIAQSAALAQTAKIMAHAGRTKKTRKDSQ